VSDADAELLERYLGDDLDEQAATRLRLRLEESPDLLRRLAERALFDAMLRTGLVANAAARVRPASGTVRRRSRARHRRGNRPRIGALVAAALVFGLLGLSLVWRDGPADRLPSVLTAAGDVEVPSGPARPGMRLAAGSSVRTGTGSSVVLGYDDGSRLALGARTSLVVPATGRAPIHLEAGVLQGDVARRTPERRLVISTSSAVITVLGTRLRLAAEAGRTVLGVEHGTVGMRRLADGHEVVVPAGFRVDSTDLRLRPLVAEDTLIEAEALTDASPADHEVESGRSVRIYRERLPGASGTGCLAIPGVGTELALPVPLRSGPCRLWVRYRDEDLRATELPTFAIVVDGRVVQEVRVAGRSRAWLWVECPLDLRPGMQVALRSLHAGVLDHDDPVFAHRSVNRIDALRFSFDDWTPGVSDDAAEAAPSPR
jgi:ferric-dicitrate binding protein FerR (iron transport regulator)